MHFLFHRKFTLTEVLVLCESMLPKQFCGTGTNLNGYPSPVVRLQEILETIDKAGYYSIECWGEPPSILPAVSERGPLGKAAHHQAPRQEYKASDVASGAKHLGL
jgi:hypothetical protein